MSQPSGVRTHPLLRTLAALSIVLGVSVSAISDPVPIQAREIETFRAASGENPAPLDGEPSGAGRPDIRHLYVSDGSASNPDTFSSAQETDLWKRGIPTASATGEAREPLTALIQQWRQWLEERNLHAREIEQIWGVQGRTFLATWNSLYELAPDGKTWSHHPDMRVWDILGDRRGRIWAATSTGLRLYAGDGWRVPSDLQGAPLPGSVYALAEDRAGRIWIGGWLGLTLFDRGRFVGTFTPRNAALPDRAVRALLVDRRNRLWIGTDRGLAHLEDQSWTVFTQADGLGDIPVRDLVETPGGEIAVSTRDGVSLYEDGRFVPQPLPIADRNLPLAVDTQGNLWAGRAVRRGGRWQRHTPENAGPRIPDAIQRAQRQPHPRIDRLHPHHGSAGDVIRIIGRGFGRDPEDLSIILGGAPVEVLTITATDQGNQEIRVEVQGANQSGRTSIRLGEGPWVTPTGIAFCAEPVVQSVSPTGAANGVTATVRGTNFDPGATVSLGGGTPRPTRGDAVHLLTDVQSGDETGSVRVENPACGDVVRADSSEEAFRYLSTTLDRVVLNQGIKDHGLVADRRTLIQHYVSTPEQIRRSDQIQVDTLEITLTDEASGVSRTEVIHPDQQHADRIPVSVGSPSMANLRNTTDSVNAFIQPHVPGFNGGYLTLHTVLKHRGQVVGEKRVRQWFRPNLPIHVLLVPVMREGYTEADLARLKANTQAGTYDLRERIMPTGRVILHWSPEVLTPDEVLDHPTSNRRVDLYNLLQLYDASHEFAAARRAWNAQHDPNALIAFGVVDPRIVTGNAHGRALWPNESQFVNRTALNWLDHTCDIVLQTATFGARTCNLTVPLHVGWAEGDLSEDGEDVHESQLFGHEFGHILGLARLDASNHDGENATHSKTDELDGGTCRQDGTAYNPYRSLYRQPGVTEPVVNPLTGEQLYHQLSVETDGDPADEHTDRGKAIMGYPCGLDNDNVFFETPDVLSILREYGPYYYSGIDLRSSTTALITGPTAYWMENRVHPPIGIDASGDLQSAASKPASTAAEPPIVSIDHPAQGRIFLESRSVRLVGSVLDPQGRPLPGAEVHWRSDRDGDLGTGAELTFTPGVGTHEITLEVTDRAGRTLSAHTSLTVEGDYDADGIADREEFARGMNPLTAEDAYADTDGDGLNLIAEHRRYLDPHDADTDQDGLGDAEEVAVGGDPQSSNLRWASHVPGPDRAPDSFKNQVLQFLLNLKPEAGAYSKD